MDLDQFIRKWSLPQEAISDLIDVFSPSEGTDYAGDDGSETGVMKKTQLNASALGCRLWRNNSGGLYNDRGQFVRYGLGNTSKRINAVFKSSDLIGVTPVPVTQSMVGSTVAVFTAVETKDPEWRFSEKCDRSVAQRNYINLVNSMGGVAMFATDATDYQAELIKRGMR